MNIPEGCKPFNLEAALAGAKTICRDGSPGPVEFHVLPEWVDPDYPIAGRIPDGTTRWYTKGGKYFYDDKYMYDLFMAPVEKQITAWRVVDGNGNFVPGGLHETLEHAELFMQRLWPEQKPSIVPLTGKWKG